MSTPKISLRGFLPKFWIGYQIVQYGVGAWAAIAFLVHGGLSTPTAALGALRAPLLAFVVQGLAFLPPEIVGAWVNAKTPKDEEVARTYSQLQQYLAHRTPGHLWYRGWNALVTVNCGFTGLQIGVAVGVALASFAVALGAQAQFAGGFGFLSGLLAGFLGARWNFDHWQQRSKFG